MELSKEAVDAIAQIIPVLLLASFLDKEILGNIRRSTLRARLVAFFYIAVILIGEVLAVIGIADGGLSGWQGLFVVVAVSFAIGSLFNLATYRLFDYDFLSGLPKKRQ